MLKLIKKLTFIQPIRTISCSPRLNEANWLSNLFVRKLDNVKEPQSDLLSPNETFFELQFHHLKPDRMAEYLECFQKFNQKISSKVEGASLIGSWTCEIGEQDTAIHLFKYNEGPATLDNYYKLYRTDQTFIKFREERNRMLRYRDNHICLAFSFWPEIKPREDPKVSPYGTMFELRSYTLKPGTMIEWGNHWARGIKQRTPYSTPIFGLFSHIGHLHVVHHMWAYNDLEHRKQMRDAAWRVPGWDECVQYTVPLVRHMKTNIVRATPFSQIK